MGIKPFLFFLLAFSSFGTAAKIGIFVSTYSNSQLVYGFRLAEELAKEHDVVVIRPDINPGTVSTLAKTNFKQIRVQLFNDSTLMSEFIEKEQKLFFKDVSLSDSEVAETRKLFVAVWHQGCQRMLSNNDFLQQIKSENFDLAFIHHYDLCPFAIAEAVGIKKAAVFISSPNIEMFTRIHGQPSPPSFVPSIMGNFTTQMTLLERFQNFFISFGSQVLTKFFESDYQRIIEDNFGKNFPQIRDLVRKSKLVFVNEFETVEYPRPTLYKIVNIGGIGIEFGTPMEGDVKQFVESSTKPVVVVSLGTVTDPRFVPEKWILEFVKFFKENQQISFIWKFENLSVPLPKNVLMKKWIPQTAILGHSKTVAFINHCGFNGLQESILAAVPVICIPLFVDQPRNAKLAEFRGFGRFVSKSDFTAKTLTAELKLVISDPSFKNAAVHFQKLIKNRPFNSSELLLRWTRFAVENDFDLTLPDLDFVKYYNLDFLVPIGFVALVVASVLLKFVLNLYYWSCCTMAFKEKQKLQ